MSFADIIGYIIGIVEQVISFVLQLFGDLINALNAIFGAIGQFLGSLVNALVDIFHKVAAFFLHLWTDYIKPAIKGLVDLYQKIRARIAAILNPILRVINRIRNFYYKHIYPWVKLAQQIISIVRVFLAALRLLGVKWAAKLDAEFAKIQGYITSFTTAIVNALNAATTWLNFISDPLGILRKDYFHATLFTGLPGVSRAVNFGKDRYLTASEAANTDGDRAMLRNPAQVLTRNADGSVTYSDASKRTNDNYVTAWNWYGPPNQ